MASENSENGESSESLRDFLEQHTPQYVCPFGCDSVTKMMPVDPEYPELLHVLVYHRDHCPAIAGLKKDQ